VDVAGLLSRDWSVQSEWMRFTAVPWIE
jgi:hypothetical protein